MVVVLTTLASLFLAILGAADTACAESGRNYRDGAAVLAVVENRRTSRWARYDGTRVDALFQRHQHAHGCTGVRGPLTLTHLRLGLRFALTGRVGPSWAARAVWYCGTYDGPGVCEARCLDGCVMVGRLAHRFYAMGQRGALAMAP